MRPSHWRWAVAAVLITVFGIDPSLAWSQSGIEPSAQSSDTYSYSQAESLYDAGAYDRAIAIAKAIGTANSLALAARSKLVQLRFVLPVEQRQAALKEALALAEEAVNLDPNHVEANLQFAIAIGYRGRLRRSTGDARRGRQLIDRALRLDPKDGWAWAALGGWHGEVVLEAGPFLARTLFDAGRSDAIVNYAKALNLDPDNLAIHASLAKLLLRFGKDRYKDRAKAELEASLALEPQNDFERRLAAESGTLLEALLAGEDHRLETLLDRMAPFSQN